MAKTKKKNEHQARADKRKEQATKLRRRLASDVKAAGITTDLEALRNKQARAAAPKAAAARRRHVALKTASLGDQDGGTIEPVGKGDDKK